MAPFLLAEAPRLLFPFARQIIADAVQNGGFPPLLLDPIDFAAAYHGAARSAQAGQQGRATATAGEPRVEPTPDATARGRTGRMNLLKAIGTIGGLTMVSRVLGFARDMLLAACMGASVAADAFIVAFRLPNIFRRLFARGRVLGGFVPMFSQRLHGEGGDEEARALRRTTCWRCSCRCCAGHARLRDRHAGVLLLVAGDYRQVPGKFELAVELTRITFPYLLLISLVVAARRACSTRCALRRAAFAPALLNVALIVGTAARRRRRQGRDASAHGDRGARSAASSQFALGWVAVRRAGVSPALRPAAHDPGGERVASC